MTRFARGRLARASMASSALALSLCACRSPSPTQPAPSASAAPSAANPSSPTAAPAPSATASASASASATAAPGPTARWQGADPIRGAAGDTRVALAPGATYRGALLTEEPVDAGAGVYTGPPAHARAALARAHTGDGALAVWATSYEESEGVVRSAVLVRALDAAGSFTGPVRLAGVVPGETQLVTADTRGPVTWVGTVQYGLRAGTVHALALRENGARAGLVQRLLVVPSPLPTPALAIAAADDGGAWALAAGSVPEATGRDEQDGYERVAHWHLARIDAAHHARALDELTNNLHSLDEAEETRWFPMAILGVTTAGAWYTVVEGGNRTLNASFWTNDSRVAPPRGVFEDTGAHVRVESDAAPGAPGATRLVLLRRGPSVIGGDDSRWLAGAERVERADGADAGGVERAEHPYLPVRSIALRCEQPGAPRLVFSWEGGSVSVDFARRGPEAVALYRLAHRGVPALPIEGDLEPLARPGALLATGRALLHFDGVSVRRFACTAGDPALRELAP